MHEYLVYLCVSLRQSFFALVPDVKSNSLMYGDTNVTFMLFFRDPSDSSEFGPKLNEFFQKKLNSMLDNKQVNLTLDEVLKKCGNESGGQGIYTLFHLEVLYDVDTLNDWQIDNNISMAIADFDAKIKVRKLNRLKQVCNRALRQIT